FSYILSYGLLPFIIFFFSSRRRHTRSKRDWSSDVCSSDLQSPDPRRPVRELDLRRKALVPYRALSRGPSSRLNISASTPRSARVRTRATPPLTARKPLTPLGESPSPRRANPPHTHAAKALTLGGAKPRRRLVWTARSVWPPARPHPWPAHRNRPGR